MMWNMRNPVRSRQLTIAGLVVLGVVVGVLAVMSLLKFA